jgi:superfamily II DNA/RNA helicase
VVGTPGRLCALVSSGALLLGKLAAAVLDEADQLLSENFYADVAWLLQQLPSRKQVSQTCMLTYTRYCVGMQS